MAAVTRTGDLGWAICRVTYGAFGEPSKLELMTPIDSGEGFSVPAQSITLFRSQDIKALRELLQPIKEGGE